MAASRLPLRKFIAAVAFVSCVFFAPEGPAVAEEPPAIAAAADLQFALEDIARLFAEQTGHRVGVRPLGWTGSGCGFDCLPGVVILEL